MAAAWWRARLVEREALSAAGRRLVFAVREWPGHLAGQHLDVRLTAGDGYRAVRSYSLSAPAHGDRVEIAVRPTPGGEVSPYLGDELPLDAAVEVRGPLGGWFVWRPEQAGPVLLAAGGSGIAPLMAMVRARRAADSTAPFRLVYSVRSPEELWYGDELAEAAGGAGGGRAGRAGADVATRLVYTRRAGPRAARSPGRIGAGDLLDPAVEPSAHPTCYVCGPTAFVEHTADLLVAAGHAPEDVRTERFG
ncbi:FAD-binding oxidoreductase [Streptomyces radicis]|uniref:FAD-binding oxidoreductase n=1 Tax=Streptomyces radicis TaxID=1750517 RepID=UPI001E33E22D|nr:FAD-binding oxidoreductase [Streptomyces radicis]